MGKNKKVDSIYLTRMGIDFALEDFRNPDGTTRIRALWDQTISGNPPEGYAIGTEYTRAQINEALQAENLQDRYQIVPSRDTSGHGTAVAGIAAGSGHRRTQTEIAGQNAGVAPESELVVVKMGSPRAEGFPRTTELMQGVDYVIKKALEYRMPVAVNVSFGNTYGSHEPYDKGKHKKTLMFPAVEGIQCFTWNRFWLWF